MMLVICVEPLATSVRTRTTDIFLKMHTHVFLFVRECIHARGSAHMNFVKVFASKCPHNACEWTCAWKRVFLTVSCVCNLMYFNFSLQVCPSFEHFDCCNPSHCLVVPGSVETHLKNNYTLVHSCFKKQILAILFLFFNFVVPSISLPLLAGWRTNILF